MLFSQSTTYITTTSSDFFLNGGNDCPAAVTTDESDDYDEDDLDSPRHDVLDYFDLQPPQPKYDPAPGKRPRDVGEQEALFLIDKNSSPRKRLASPLASLVSQKPLDAQCNDTLKGAQCDGFPKLTLKQFSETEHFVVEENGHSENEAVAKAEVVSVEDTPGPQNRMDEYHNSSLSSESASPTTEGDTVSENKDDVELSRRENDATTTTTNNNDAVRNSNFQKPDEPDIETVYDPNKYWLLSLSNRVLTAQLNALRADNSRYAERLDASLAENRNVLQLSLEDRSVQHTSHETQVKKVSVDDRSLDERCHGRIVGSYPPAAYSIEPATSSPCPIQPSVTSTVSSVSAGIPVDVPSSEYYDETTGHSVVLQDQPLTPSQSLSGSSSLCFLGLGGVTAQFSEGIALSDAASARTPLKRPCSKKHLNARFAPLGAPPRSSFLLGDAESLSSYSCPAAQETPADNTDGYPAAIKPLSPARYNDTLRRHALTPTNEAGSFSLSDDSIASKMEVSSRGYQCESHYSKDAIGYVPGASTLQDEQRDFNCRLTSSALRRPGPSMFRRSKHNFWKSPVDDCSQSLLSVAGRLSADTFAPDVQKPLPSYADLPIAAQPYAVAHETLYQIQPNVSKSVPFDQPRDQFLSAQGSTDSINDVVILESSAPQLLQSTTDNSVATGRDGWSERVSDCTLADVWDFTGIPGVFDDGTVSTCSQKTSSTLGTQPSAADFAAGLLGTTSFCSDENLTSNISLDRRNSLYEYNPRSCLSSHLTEEDQFSRHPSVEKMYAGTRRSRYDEHYSTCGVMKDPNGLLSNHSDRGLLAESSRAS